MSEFKAWQFFTRFDICDEATGELYLRRWRIIQTPWFAIFLHKIVQPDKDRHLHDHPWNFLSIILWGSYVELLGERIRGGYWVPLRTLPRTHVRRRWLSIGFRRSTDAHRIELLRRNCKPTWTLVLTGRRSRSWGFYTEDGWVPYRKYLGLDEVQP